MDLDDDRTRTPLAACNSTGDYQVPHVLISTALDEEQTLLDAASCRPWLADFPALPKYSTIEGIYKKISTLITISMPVMIRDLLLENLACSFVGYVVSPNMYNEIAVPEKLRILASHTEDSKLATVSNLRFKDRRLQRSMSGDSSYESGAEDPTHHKLLTIEVKKACLAKSDTPIDSTAHESTQNDGLFESDSYSGSGNRR